MKNEPNSARVPAIPDGFPTAERIDALRRFAILALLGLAIGGGIGWTLASVFGTVWWRANALVQVGQVGIYPSPTLVVQSIEPVARALERTKSPAFLEGLLKRLGLPTDQHASDPEAKLLRRAIRVSNPRNSDLLEIDVARGDADDARKTLHEAVRMLAEMHAKLADPMVATLKTQLAQVESALASVTTERDRIISTIDSQSGVRSADRFSESALLSRTLADRDAEVRSLSEQRGQLNGLLDPSRTYPTSLLGTDAVTVRRFGPDRVFGTIAGAFVGLALALFAMRFRRAA